MVGLVWVAGGEMRSEGEETGSWCQERWESPAERESHGTTSSTANEILCR